MFLEQRSRGTAGSAPSGSRHRRRADRNAKVGLHASGGRIAATFEEGDLAPRSALGPNGPEQVLAFDTGMQRPFSIVLGNLYWVDWSNSAGKQIYRAPLANGGPKGPRPGWS